MYCIKNTISLQRQENRISRNVSKAFHRACGSIMILYYANIIKILHILRSIHAKQILSTFQLNFAILSYYYQTTSIKSRILVYVLRAKIIPHILVRFYKTLMIIYGIALVKNIQVRLRWRTRSLRRISRNIHGE